MHILPSWGLGAVQTLKSISMFSPQVIARDAVVDAEEVLKLKDSYDFTAEFSG